LQDLPTNFFNDRSQVLFKISSVAGSVDTFRKEICNLSLSFLNLSLKMSLKALSLPSLKASLKMSSILKQVSQTCYSFQLHWSVFLLTMMLL